MIPTNIEPEAITVFQKNGANIVAEQEHNILLFSIAISLKRIADVSEKVTTGNVSTELWQQLNNMAWEMGQSFGRGQGT
jgi:hypothetical protein